MPCHRSVSLIGNDQGWTGRCRSTNRARGSTRAGSRLHGVTRTRRQRPGNVLLRESPVVARVCLCTYVRRPQHDASLVRWVWVPCSRGRLLRSQVSSGSRLEKKSMDRRGPRGARTPIAQVRPYEHHSHTAPSVGKKKQSFHFSIIQTVLLGKYNSHVYSRKKTILNITSLHFEIQYKVSKSEISYSLVIRPRLVLKKFYKIFQIPCHIEFLTHEALNIDKNKTNYTV
jgi:hypothetical protein